MSKNIVFLVEKESDYVKIAEARIKAVPERLF